MLKRQEQISGRPVYAPARTGTGIWPAVSFAHEAAARIDTEYISQQVTRMEGAVDTEPDARDRHREGVRREHLQDHPRRTRKRPMGRTTTCPRSRGRRRRSCDCRRTISRARARAAETIKRMLMNLATLVQGSAELRNAYGTGHGKSKSQARSSARHHAMPASSRQRRDARRFSL